MIILGLSNYYICRSSDFLLHYIYACKGVVDRVRLILQLYFFDGQFWGGVTFTLADSQGVVGSWKPYLQALPQPSYLRLHLLSE